LPYAGVLAMPCRGTGEGCGSRMIVLGLSCDYHDSAAALVVDGEVVAAAEEERFSRIKHDRSLPEGAVASCLAISGHDVRDIDAVVFHEKPLVVTNRVLAARQRRGPGALGAFVREFPVLLRENLMIAERVERLLRDLGADDPPPLRYAEHHLSHAAAAFYPSPFPAAALLTVDGIGEWATATLGAGANHTIDLLAEQRYPHSLGLLYSLITQWCGFQANDGEYKLMGLAPYGEPRFADALAELAAVNEDGSLTVDVKRVAGWGSRSMRSRRLRSLLGGPPRSPGAPLTDREADLARSMQELVETAVLRMARHLHQLTGETNLCMAGGVALNCVANGRLLREGPFEDIWVQPAAGDAGSAVGAALWYWHGETGHGRRPPPPTPTGFVPDGMRGAALGPEFGGDEISEWLAGLGVAHERELLPGPRSDRVARELARGAIVGWFSGRMEFGPRSLGCRSILADPRSSTVHRDLNLRVKGRESFRPFAPAVLWEHASEWFELDRPSPYMLFTHQVVSARRCEVAVEPLEMSDRATVKRSEIPACTHIDGSARVQTVHRESRPEFHSLLSAFHRLVGCPVLLNTSFNVAGEPIVCTPDDALATAVKAGLDLLVLGDCIIDRQALEALGGRAAA
jgi:carbamoyltransferase